MADLVPEDIRGRYFAWRNTYLSVIQVGVGVVSGMLMQYIAGPQPPWLVFMVVFFVAAFSRFFSGIMLVRQYEPPLTYTPVQKDFTYAQFLLKAPTSNFARFTIFIALVHGATAFAGPFFSPYFLKDLQMPYLQYALVSNSHLIGMLLFLPFWGRIADRHGNWLVLKLSALGIAVLPMPYLIFYSFPSLCILGFAGGAIWSAFGLSSFNYLLDAVTPQRRIRCSAYMTATIGFSVFVFGLMGGVVVYYVPALRFWRSPYQTLFLISAVMRSVVFCIFVGFGLVREIREVHPVRIRDVMGQFPGVQLSIGFARTVYRALRRI
jgi:MFS family permease